MDFYKKHFKLKNLFKRPDKFFLALLVSPIHAAEVRYKKKYHLRFAHARKLFLFDLILLLSTVAIGAAAIFFYTYDPTVTKMISLKMEAVAIHETGPSERIESGDNIKYTIRYENYSDVNLINNKLTLNLPTTFLIDHTKLPDSLDLETNTISLPNLSPGASGVIELFGTLYGDVDEHYNVVGTWTYMQSDRNALEQKSSNIISLLPDSKIKTEIIEVSEKIIANGKTTARVAIVNEDDITMKNVVINWNQDNELSIKNTNEELNPAWQIDSLDPGERLETDVEIFSNLPENTENISWKVTPNIRINDIELKQKSAVHTYEVVSPKAGISASWTSDSLLPGSVADLQINLTNSGEIDLSDLSLSIETNPAVVDIGRARQLNASTYSGGYLVIDKRFNAGLRELKVGEHVRLVVKIPIKTWISGITDPGLTTRVLLSSNVKDVPGATLDKSIETTKINIGTNLSMTASSRYYTDEGDQLGRGPLPPRVGKETKYWALITVDNSSNFVQDVSFRASLPAHITWTGRSSVSHGQNLKFNESNRTVSWYMSQLGPHAKIGLYMELVFTPNSSHLGTAPTLLNNLSITGTDSLTGLNISKTINNIDLSLQNDSIGRSKGTLVTN